MNDRLQEILLKKYALTKNQRYLTWLEQQSQMHISTIDSLAYDLFKRFGCSVGFGRDLGIQPLEKERKELIKDLLSEELDDGKPITSQIGMNYAGASKVIDVYWKELTRKGYTISEVLEKDWGDVGREPVLSNFQQVIKAVLKEFEEKYIGQGMNENRTMEETLDLGWKLLGRLPREELDRVDTKILDKYYKPSEEE